MKTPLVMVIADTVPIGKAFRYQKKWWRKVNDNKGERSKFEVCFFSLATFVVMRKIDLPDDWRKKYVHEFREKSV